MVVASPQEQKGVKMWIDTNECVPLSDGIYLVQTVYGEVQPMNYTRDGGWNTHRDLNGEVYTDHAMSILYVVRWYKPEQPPKVPKAWKNKYRNREVIK